MKARPTSVLRALAVSMATLLTAAAAATAQPDTAPDVRRELSELRGEVQRLRSELDALRDLLRAPVPQASPVGERQRADAAPPPAASPELEMLRTQVAELARTKVESVSTMRVRIFGTIHSHLFANTGEANWLDLPNIVPPQPSGASTGTLSATLRQSRLGLAVDGPTIGTVRASGTVVADFFGGIPGFQTGQPMGLPRLLVAFARFDGERTSAQVGQDHVVLAPRDPTSLSALAFPALFRSGNLYLRAPLARVDHRSAGGLRLTGAIVAPIGGDVPGEDYRFVPPALGGERSRRPALQARAAYARGEAGDARHVDLGLSGHYGWERVGSQLAGSWAAALDVAARRDRVGVAGELFGGDNVDAFGGATGLRARSRGGWVEAQVFPDDRWSLNAGYGTDRLRHPSAALPRAANRGAYANAIFALTPELRASLEYQWLGTRPGQGAERRNHHWNWVFAYEF